MLKNVNRVKTIQYKFRFSLGYAIFSTFGTSHLPAKGVGVDSEQSFTHACVILLWINVNVVLVQAPLRGGVDREVICQQVQWLARRTYK